MTKKRSVHFKQNEKFEKMGVTAWFGCEGWMEMPWALFQRFGLISAKRHFKRVLKLYTPRTVKQRCTLVKFRKAKLQSHQIRCRHTYYCGLSLLHVHVKITKDYRILGPGPLRMYFRPLFNCACALTF